MYEAYQEEDVANNEETNGVTNKYELTTNA